MTTKQSNAELEREFWVKSFLAITKGAPMGNWVPHAAQEADKALEEYRKRFKQPRSQGNDTE
jgi:hypothetical protein